MATKDEWSYNKKWQPINFVNLLDVVCVYYLTHSNMPVFIDNMKRKRIFVCNNVTQTCK